MTVCQEVGISLSGYSADKIKDGQSKDPNLKFLLQWLKTKQEPQEGELFISSKIAKRYWINKELFSLDADGIVRHQADSEINSTQLVIPETG